jgi:serine/alanine adding enzyme
MNVTTPIIKTHEAPTLKVHSAMPQDASLWDQYVTTHPDAGPYHLFGWQEVVKQTYGFSTYYLFVTEDACSPSHDLEDPDRPRENRIFGVLPLVHMKHPLFGNKLVSMPFVDTGGILADGSDAGEHLLAEALDLARMLKAERLELRHTRAFSFGSGDFSSVLHLEDSAEGYGQKARMLLELPNSSTALLKSFKSKLRNQIKKPLREGLQADVGGLDYLENFYQVHSVNMRDLGSPVHSKKIVCHLLKVFPKKAQIIAVLKGKQCLAAGVVMGFRDTLVNPWSSALREFSRLSPNMLLYWTMLEYASDHGYKYFDFGRATVHEGTYKFKEQWGAKPVPLHWHCIATNGKPIKSEWDVKTRFAGAVRFWKKLPIPVANLLGPRIRKHISL